MNSTSYTTSTTSGLGTGGTVVSGPLSGGASIPAATSVGGTTVTTSDKVDVVPDAQMTRSSEQLLVDRQQQQVAVQTVATARKFVTTEHVSTSVPITQERVVVERAPLPEGTRMAADFREERRELPLMQDRVVATKESVPVERVRLNQEVERVAEAVREDDGGAAQITTAGVSVGGQPVQRDAMLEQQWPANSVEQSGSIAIPKVATTTRSTQDLGGGDLAISREAGPIPTTTSVGQTTTTSADRLQAVPSSAMATESVVTEQTQPAVAVAAINKYVTAEHVSTTVPTMKERAVLEREPIAESEQVPATIGEERRELPLTEERVLATKETKPVERVLLRQTVEQIDAVSEADVRKEHVGTSTDGVVVGDKSIDGSIITKTDQPAVTYSSSTTTPYSAGV